MANLASIGKNYLEIKAKGVELKQVYEAQDREEEIQLKIFEDIREKHKAKSINDKIREEYYTSSLAAWDRKLRIHEKVCRALEERLSRSGQGDD